MAYQVTTLAIFPENDKALKEHLDLLDKEREAVEVRMILEKRSTEHYFNKRVRPRTFKIGDIVLRESRVTMKEEGKLGL